MVKMFQLSASSRALICTTCKSKTVIWQSRVLGMVQRIVRERLGKNSHQAKSRLCVFAYSHRLLRQSHSWILVLSIPPLTSGDPDTSCGDNHWWGCYGLWLFIVLAASALLHLSRVHLLLGWTPDYLYFLQTDKKNNWAVFYFKITQKQSGYMRRCVLYTHETGLTLGW